MSDQVDGDLVDPIAPLRKRLLGVVMPAIETLARAGRGEGVFQSVEQMRSCVALARLAPLLLGARPTETQDDELEQVIEMTPEREEAWRVLQRPFYGPGQPGCAILEDPKRVPKWFSWKESCRRAGVDPHEVFEEQERYERARTD